MPRFLGVVHLLVHEIVSKTGANIFLLVDRRGVQKQVSPSSICLGLFALIQIGPVACQPFPFHDDFQPHDKKLGILCLEGLDEKIGFLVVTHQASFSWHISVGMGRRTFCDIFLVAGLLRL